MAVGRFAFPNPDGLRLAALLDRPPGEPVAYALFAHRFTCGKDNLAASLILIHSSPAVLAASAEMPEARAVVTIAAPADSPT